MIEGYGLLQFVDTSFGDKSLSAMGWDSSEERWLAIRVANDGMGPQRLSGRTNGSSANFADAAQRESWKCPEQDRCNWHRELSSDGGVTWRSIANGELTRSASDAAWIPIPNARATVPGLLSGGQPSAGDLEWAARNGYRTVINLRTPGETSDIADEEGLVGDLGMSYVSLPIAGAEGITGENATALAELLDDEGAQPILLHCGSGNRIGALLALKAHELDGLPPDEALEFGKASGLTRLEPLVREKLGLN
jgi:uncharacterized protein (TIGR01244 family)